MLLYELMEPSKRRRAITETGLTYKGYPCTVDCMGHHAGHEWAVRWGINSPEECPLGNSNSFWEGCKSKSEEQQPEEVTESFNTGTIKIGDIIFDISVHALERMEERQIPISTAQEFLRRVSSIKDKLSQGEPGQPVWVHDASLGISMGLRPLSSGKIQWGTVILGEPRNRDARYPVIDMNV